MQPQDNNDIPPINQHMQAILSIIAAIVILAIIGLAHQFINPPPSTPTNEEAIASNALPTPTIPPTFTPTSFPTPRLTFSPIATHTPIATPTSSPTPTPFVVDWRWLGHLTSIEFTTTTVVEIERRGVWHSTSWADHSSSYTDHSSNG